MGSGERARDCSAPCSGEMTADRSRAVAMQTTCRRFSASRAGAVSHSAWRCGTAPRFSARLLPIRRRHKWRLAQKLIENHDVVGFQETRGSLGGLATLPVTHEWYRSFLAFSAATGGSGGGGCVMGACRRLGHLYPRVDHRVLCHGRARLVVCMPHGSDEGLIFVDVHIEPASNMATKRGILDGSAAEVALRPRCIPFPFGNWNFVHPDDPRVDLRQLAEVGAHEPLAAYFERRLVSFVELEHSAPTRRQLSDGVAVFLSRIYRIYAKLCPVELAELSVRVQTLGDALCTTNPSDHAPVSVRLARRRSRHPEMRPPLSSSVCRSEAFAQASARLLACQGESGHLVGCVVAGSARYLCVPCG